MWKREIVVIFLVLLSVAGTIFSVFAYKNAKEANTITLIARAPEKGNWSPQTINVERGKEVSLTIRNTDLVSHGFYIPALDLLVGEIKAGEVERINFTVKEAGEYLFLCTIWCSEYHMQMRGKIIAR